MVWTLVVAFTIGRISARFIPARPSKNKNLAGKFRRNDAGKTLSADEIDGRCEMRVDDDGVRWKSYCKGGDDVMCELEGSEVSVERENPTVCAGNRLVIEGGAARERSAKEEEKHGREECAGSVESGARHTANTEETVFYRLSAPPSWHFNNPPPCIDTLRDAY